MRVLIVEPLMEPREAEIGDDLKSMQDVVGGYIEVIHPFQGDGDVALVCDEDGKLNGDMPNRGLRDERGGITDVVAGTFFLCKSTWDGELVSLPDEEMERFKEKFKEPEIFFRVGHEIRVQYFSSVGDDVKDSFTQDEER